MKKTWLILAVFLVMIQIASANEIAARAGMMLWEFFQSPGILFGFTLLFIFVLLTAIYASAIKKVPVFEEGGRKANVVAASLGLLTTIALAYFGRDMGITAFLERYLTPFGYFGAIALAFVMFALVYQGFKDDEHKLPLSWMAAGLALIFFGMITESEQVTAWGGVIFVIGLIIFLLFTHEWPKGEPGDSKSGSGGLGAGGSGSGGRTSTGPRQAGAGGEAGPSPERGARALGDDSRREPQRREGDFSHDLGDIAVRLNNYAHLFNEFTQRGNEILEVHHHHAQGRGEGATQQQWNAYLGVLDNLNSTASEITELFRRIITHGNFSNMNDEQLANFRQLTIFWTNALQRMQEYRDGFRHRFMRGMQPERG